MKTKKLLVPIDMENPEKDIRDFLYATKLEEKFVFRGIKSGKLWTNGVVSFIGKSISKNDIFTRIMDSGMKIDDVNKLLTYLESYIEQVKDMKLGNLAQIKDNSEYLEIESIGRQPKIKKNKLP